MARWTWITYCEKEKNAGYLSFHRRKYGNRCRLWQGSSHSRVASQRSLGKAKPSCLGLAPRFAGLWVMRASTPRTKAELLQTLAVKATTSALRHDAAQINASFVSLSQAFASDTARKFAMAQRACDNAICDRTKE